MSVCHFQDEMTRDRSPRVYKVVWVLVVFKLFRRPLPLANLQRVVVWRCHMADYSPLRGILDGFNALGMGVKKM